MASVPLAPTRRTLTRLHPVIRTLGASLLLVGLGGASEADYPAASLDRAALTAWVKANTDLPPERVAMAGPIHVVAVTGANRSGNIRKATVLGEVIDRDWAARHRLVSWRTEIQVDCAASRVKSPNGRSYRERRRKGEASAVVASADWASPQPGDPILGVIRALCATDFQWPLRPPEAVKVASRSTSRGAPPRSESLADAPIPTAARVPEPPPPPPVTVLAEATAPPPPAPSLPPRPPRPKPPVAAKPKPAPAAAPGAYAVQVAASATASRAQAELATLSKVLSGEVRGLRSTVTPATVGGKVYYRSMFVGLGARQAQTLCRAISRLGYQCMVRKMTTGRPDR